MVTVAPNQLEPHDALCRRQRAHLLIDRRPGRQNAVDHEPERPQQSRVVGKGRDDAVEVVVGRGR